MAHVLLWLKYLALDATANALNKIAPSLVKLFGGHGMQFGPASAYEAVISAGAKDN